MSQTTMIEGAKFLMAIFGTENKMSNLICKSWVIIESQDFGGLKCIQFYGSSLMQWLVLFLILLVLEEWNW